MDCQEGIGSPRDTQKRTRQDICSGLGNLHDLKQIQFLDPMRWWSIVPTLRRLEKNSAPHRCALWPVLTTVWAFGRCPNRARPRLHVADVDGLGQGLHRFESLRRELVPIVASELRVQNRL